jgi:hypothetical protein
MKRCGSQSGHCLGSFRPYLPPAKRDLPWKKLLSWLQFCRVLFSSRLREARSSERSDTASCFVLEDSAAQSSLPSASFFWSHQLLSDPGLRFRRSERVSTFSEHRLAWLVDRAKRCSEKVLTRLAPYVDSCALCVVRCALCVVRCALCSVFIKHSLVLCEVFDPAGRRPPAAGRRRPARPPARSIGPCGSTGPDGSSTARAEGRLRPAAGGLRDRLRGQSDPAGPQDPMGLRPAAPH